MDNSFAALFYGISFLISLALAGFLWWLAYRYPPARRFWTLLAAAWTLNQLSSFIWGIFAAWLGEDIPAVIDILYVLRYVLVGLALWFYPATWPWHRLLEVMGAMIMAAAVLWFGFVGRLQVVGGQPLSHVLGGTIFPILDAGMVYLGWRRWQGVRGHALEYTLGWLALSNLAYGIANWVNFSARAASPEANSLVAMVLWLMTDVFAALAGWQFTRQRAEASRADAST